jgi:hypothetical protein
MKHTSWLGMALVAAIVVLTGFQGSVCHALERHPKDSDKTSGYWCFDCHNFQKNAANTKWVRTEIKLKTAVGGTVAVDYSGPGALVKDSPPYNGPCQACHTATNHYRNDGSGFDHFVGADCLTCHSHFQKNMFTLSFVGSQSHVTHLVDAATGIADSKGPAIAECTVCHNGTDYTRFGTNGDTIENTDVCDGCHSPDGAFDGVNDPVVGAKTNWVDGIYRATGKKLQEGKDSWCATCHDNGISLIGGISAPNVMGNNTTYGYNVSGHGKNSTNYVQCDGCHDLTILHLDGESRTYVANSTLPKKRYGRGYRLNEDIIIPRNGEGAETSFTLCINCHPYGQVTDKATTNFRDDVMPFTYHLSHLKHYPTSLCWDSDWNGKADSAMSCPACHNVHGSSTPAMIRNGELIGHDQALQFRWYQADKTTVTTNVLNSAFGALECATPSEAKLSDAALQHNHVCWGCHPVAAQDPTLIRYKRTPINVTKVKVNEVWTTDLNDTVKDAFAVGEAIRYHARFTIVGDQSFFIQSPRRSSQAYNTSGVEWLTRLARSETLGAGIHEWSWDAAVPSAAEAGSSAEVTIQLKMYQAEGGEVIDQHKKSHVFNILQP